MARADCILSFCTETSVFRVEKVLTNGGIGGSIVTFGRAFADRNTDVAGESGGM